MLSTLQFNWALYRRFVGAQMRSQMQYRGPFILDTLGQFIGNIVDFGTVAVLFTQLPALGGWSLPEVAFLYGTSGLAFGLADMLIAGFDYQVFGATMVKQGGFDQVLTRPVNAFVQILASQFVLRRIGRMAQGALILGLAIANLNLAWTWDKLAFMLITIAASTLFFSGLFVFGAGVSFWTVESLEAMNIITYGGQYMAQYPMHIYPGWLRSIFTFIIPMAFINYYPTLWLFGKADPLGGPAWLAFLSPFVCAIVFAIGVRFWWYGVRHYTSTGT